MNSTHLQMILYIYLEELAPMDVHCQYCKLPTRLYWVLYGCCEVYGLETLSLNYDMLL